jgi:hypothetical protein
MYTRPSVVKTQANHPTLIERLSALGKFIGAYDLWFLKGSNPDQGARPTQLHPPAG